MRVERSPRLAHGDVDASQRGTGITGDEGLRAQAGGGVGPHLLDHHPDQRVIPVQECERRIRFEASIQTAGHRFAPRAWPSEEASVERNLISYHLGSAPDESSLSAC